MSEAVLRVGRMMDKVGLRPKRVSSMIRHWELNPGLSLVVRVVPMYYDGDMETLVSRVLGTTRATML